MRILLVEDNPSLVKATSALLKCWQHSVETAMTGKDALDIVGHEAFDLVLMDENLPDMSGRVVATCIRERENGTHVAIVGLTAALLEGERNAYLDAGMDMAIEKPISREQLDMVVKTLKLH